MKKNQHVVKTNDGWGVRGENNSKITKNFDTKKEATELATAIAKNNTSEVFIHGMDGKIQSRNSYGNDPYPPQG